MHDILVHIDDAPESDARARWAQSLASSLGAHLRALVVAAGPPLPYGPGAEQMYGAYQDAMARLQAESEALRTRAEAAYGAQTLLLSTIADRVPIECASAMRVSDLLVVAPPTANRSFIDDDVFQAALFMSGRPVVLAPRNGASVFEPGKVLIAWKNCKEAARAIHDAMPILKAAKDVELLAIKENPESEHVGEEARARMTAALQERGVRARQSALVESKVGAGEALLAHAQDAALIVMGGYGRWRLSELIFGGVTQHVLEHAKTPILMSR